MSPIPVKPLIAATPASHAPSSLSLDYAAPPRDDDHDAPTPLLTHAARALLVLVALASLPLPFMEMDYITPVRVLAMLIPGVGGTGSIDQFVRLWLALPSLIFFSGFFVLPWHVIRLARVRPGRRIRAAATAAALLLWTALAYAGMTIGVFFVVARRGPLFDSPEPVCVFGFLIAAAGVLLVLRLRRARKTDEALSVALVTPFVAVAAPAFLGGVPYADPGSNLAAFLALAWLLELTFRAARFVRQTRRVTSRDSGAPAVPPPCRLASRP